VRFKGLSGLKRPELHEIVLATLPEHILMAQYAMAKAFKINELVGVIHKGSYEWYGYTIANRGCPELIVDIGLPRNDQNFLDYTRIGSERIAEYQESLPADAVINGWIHSHGDLEYEHFSGTDERNQVTVLDYVTALLRKPVSKKEVLIKDLALLVKDDCTEESLEKGSVSIITDAPVKEARIMETIYGSFCYAIVIGDQGWHTQEIHYKRRGILSGQTTVSRKDARIVLVDTARLLTQSDIDALCGEVKENLQPMISMPERFERGCT
jgi:hypothetical protein